MRTGQRHVADAAAVARPVWKAIPPPYRVSEKRRLKPKSCVMVG